MPCAAREAGKASRLNCGFFRERGTVRTSTTSLTSAAANRAANSSIGRVECPMVKKGLAIADDYTRVAARRLQLSGATRWCCRAKQEGIVYRISLLIYGSLMRQFALAA